MIAKLTRPHPHAAVKRVRLFKLLDQRKRYPIIWVNGPAGSGKTTVVASYLESRKAKTFWYQVDKGDGDPATLFYYLAELAKQSKNRKKSPLPNLTADHLPDLTGFTRRFFRELFIRLGPDAALVLDNCQDAADETFHRILRDASEEIPQGTSIFALSRSTLPDELTRNVANRRVYEIGWDDLRLTQTETQEIAHLGLDAAATLHRQCDGWVAGLVLLRASNAASCDAAVRALHGKEAVFAYFAGELLTRSTSEAQKLLTATALFPYTTIAMASSLTDIPDCESIFSELYKKHYFVSRRIEGEVTYQYHDLFREYLLAKLTQSCDTQSLASLRMRAAQILEANNDVSQAVTLFQQACDFVNVVRLIRTHALEFIESGRWQTVFGWFAELPDEYLINDPWLQQFKAECLVPIDIVQASALMNSAREEFIARQDDFGHARTASNLSFLLYMLGDSVEIYDQWMAELEIMIARRGDSLSMTEAFETWTAYSTFVILRTGTGRYIDQAQQWLTTYRSSGGLHADVFATLWLLSSSLEVWTTKASASAELVPRLERSAKQDLSPIIAGDVWRMLGYWYFWNAEYEQCITYYDRAIEFGTRYHVAGQIVTPGCYKAISLSQLRDFAGAQQALDSIATTVPKRGAIHDMYYKWAQAHVAYKRGDFVEALRVTEGLHTSQIISEVINEVRYASYLIEAERYADALQAVARSRAMAKGTIWRMMDALACCVEAEVHLRMGQSAEALAALHAMLNEARNPRKAALLTWVEHWLPRQFAVAAEENIEDETVHQLIRRFKIPADSPTNKTWPWPIKIRALGELQIELDSIPFSGKGKAQHKLLDLLRVMIALGAQQVSEDEICEWLWPDADGDVAAGNLRTSLHRLRKLLKHDDAITVHDNRVSLNDKFCWLDTQAFEHLTAESNEALAAEKFEKAIRLYNGHLFEKESHAWVLPLRDRLRGRFQRSVLNLTKVWETNGNAEKAEALYYQCLERDGSAEMVYRQLMLHLKARGRHAEALDVYRRCETALLNSLATRPSPETRLLYESLRDI